MNHLGVTPQLRQQNQFMLKRRLNTLSLFFLGVCLLPFLLYSLYYFNLVPNRLGQSLAKREAATALLVVEQYGKTGTAFLVSPNKLLTARHVVADLKPGDKVKLVFEKAIPEITTTATVEWIAPTTFAEGDIDYFISDVALLKLDDPQSVEKLEPMPLGDSNGIGNLTEIIAIGYPNGDYSIKRGDINSDTYSGKDLFKVDPATNPGDSGGPMILAKDKEYKVIGMMVGGLKNAQGENVANKVNNIFSVIQGISLD